MIAVCVCVYACEFSCVDAFFDCVCVCVCAMPLCAVVVVAVVVVTAAVRVL